MKTWGWHNTNPKGEHMENFKLLLFFLCYRTQISIPNTRDIPSLGQVYRSNFQEETL